MESGTTPPPPPEQPPASAPAAQPPPPGVYPVQVDAQRQDEYHRFLPLVKWLLAFPHYVVLAFVALGAFFVAIFGFFAVLFTGRWPRGAFDYMVGTFRWAYRVTAYFHLMVDAYPPFSMADDPNYPVRLNIEYPERIDNWRPLVQWLLAIPYLFIAGVLYWLTGILTFVAFFLILFTKRIPREMFELMVPGLRWNMRGSAYAYFVTDRYPPFVWG